MIRKRKAQPYKNIFYNRKITSSLRLKNNQTGLNMIDLRDTHTHDCTNSTKWLKLKWHAWELSAAIKYDFIKHNDVDRNSQCVILQISLLQDRVTLYNCIYIEFQGKLYKIYAYKMEVYIPTNVAR